MENNGAHIVSDRESFWRLLRSFVTLKLAISTAVLVGVGMFLVWWSFDKPPNSLSFYLVREIGKALFITAVINGAVKWYLSHQSQTVDKLIEDIRKGEIFSEFEGLRKHVDEEIDKLGLLTQELARQTKHISARTQEIVAQTSQITGTTQHVAGFAASLVAMQEAGIARLYPNRGEASEDIRASLEEPGITSIQVIGISLNDFVRQENKSLHSAWQQIKAYINSPTPPPGSDRLDIQLLLVDPQSNGGFLRSQAESQEGELHRLELDVEASLIAFSALRPKCPQVTFEVRLYRTAPILYMVRTPKVSFIQQYYFRPRHGGDICIPVVRCHSRTSSSPGSISMHEELDSHFKWVRDHATVKLSDYRTMYSRGVDRAVRDANITNFFYDTELSRNRILSLIRDPKNTRLWIKGISLRSFFSFGSLSDAILQACNNGVDVRVLLIDPDKEQARFRAFRETCLNGDAGQFDNFSPKGHTFSTLYRDTTRSRDYILTDFASRLRAGRPNNFQARMFRSAPEAFMLLTDTSVLVEQYHYGKLANPARAILGGDVPIVEYASQAQDADGYDQMKDTYEIFRNHFEFVFDHFSEDILAEGARAAHAG